MERIERLMELIDKFPDDMFSRHALAMEYIKMGLDDKALAVMVELLELNPRYIGTYYHLGKVYERMANLKKALDVYQEGESMARSLNALHELRELAAAKANLLDLLEQ